LKFGKIHLLETDADRLILEVEGCGISDGQ
jgi:hypothetical protein